MRTMCFLPASRSFHGIRVIGDHLYYSESERVLRVPFKAGDRKKTPANAVPELVADLSSGGGGDRFTHTIDAHPLTGEIFVTTGRYDESSCTASASRVGAVLRIGARAASVMGDIVVGRCRNPMYMRCKSFGCYAMELSGDSWTGVGGTEKLVAIVNSTDVGFPCCIQPNKPYGEFGADCSKITKQIADFPLTDTPFGFDWDEKRQWPAPYTGHLFIGNHGSFYSGSSGNPSAFEDAGLIAVEWDYVNKRPVASTAPGVAGIYPQFVPNGWGGAGVLGERLTDVMFHPDGRLFLADDFTGHILWIAPTNLMTNGTFVPLGDVPSTVSTSATTPAPAGSTVSTTSGAETTATTTGSVGTGADTTVSTTRGSVGATSKSAAAPLAVTMLAVMIVAIFVSVL
jgi:glucose/arabinose dehydrogenase